VTITVNKVKIYVKLKKGARLPIYATTGSAGADLYACIDHDIELKPRDIALVPTGIYIQLPEGYEAQIRPRSGLASKYGITLLNAPGTIDWDYRGEIKVILINLGKETFKITNGMRIAQMVIAPVVQGQFIEVAQLESTDRGEGGFGHSGIR